MLHSLSLCVRALKWRNVCYEAALNRVNCYNVLHCYACKLRVRNRTKRRNGEISETHNSYDMLSEISVHTQIFGK